MDTRAVKTRDASEHVGLSESTLEKRRLTGDGPPFVKIGRAVRYRICDLDAWIAAQLTQSTSEQRAA